MVPAKYNRHHDFRARASLCDRGSIFLVPEPQKELAHIHMECHTNIDVFYKHGHSVRASCRTDYTFIFKKYSKNSIMGDGRNEWSHNGDNNGDGFRV